MEFCNRCGCPVEEPIVYADEICCPAPDLDSACDHVVVCVHCADVRRQEVFAFCTP